MSGDRQFAGNDQIRVPKTAQLIASRLRRQIVKGDLREGDVLPSESVLTQQFGVSRPTLREAIRILEAEALVTVRRGANGGAQVHPPDAGTAARYTGLVLEYRGTTVRDVFDALLVIEPACVSLLARERTAEQLETLHGAISDARALRDDLPRLIRAQTDFHSLVLDMAGSETLRVLSGVLRNIIDRANWSRFGRRSAAAEDHAATLLGLRSHERLVELIESGDAERASALWARHLDASGDYIVGVPERARGILDLLDWDGLME